MAENLEIDPPPPAPIPPASPGPDPPGSFPAPARKASRLRFHLPRPRRGRGGKPWRHPQAWVPRELSFILFLAPFVFWPLVIGLAVLNFYSSEMADVPIENLKDLEQPTISYIYTGDGTLLAELYREHRLP
ncbi:MAG: hypothetical protein LBC90_06275, partial [Candidatus Adiutrix sp.]|nr:hypothetical protein [Candidatus Adiutrix sp.]